MLPVAITGGLRSLWATDLARRRCIPLSRVRGSGGARLSLGPWIFLHRPNMGGNVLPSTVKVGAEYDTAARRNAGGVGRAGGRRAAMLLPACRRRRTGHPNRAAG